MSRTTTPQVIASLRAALEELRRHGDRAWREDGVGSYVVDAAPVQDETAAALAALRDRVPLADDPGLDRLVYDEFTADDGATLGARIRRLLTSVDRHLFGTADHND